MRITKSLFDLHLFAYYVAYSSILTSNQVSLGNASEWILCGEFLVVLCLQQCTLYWRKMESLVSLLDLHSEGYEGHEWPELNQIWWQEWHALLCLYFWWSSFRHSSEKRTIDWGCRIVGSRCHFPVYLCPSSSSKSSNVTPRRYGVKILSNSDVPVPNFMAFPFCII